MAEFHILIEYVFFYSFRYFFGFDGYAQEIITIEIDGSNLPDESNLE